MFKLVIGVVGKANSGKTSFINALSGGIVGQVSSDGFICYEKSNSQTTYMPLVYRFKNNTSYYYNTRCEDNVGDCINKELPVKNLFYQNKGYKGFLESSFNYDLCSFPNIDYDIIEFPNLDNNVGSSNYNIFLKYVNLCDIVFYITDYKTGFTHESELKLFNSIHSEIIQKKNNGIFIDLSIVVNKVDNPLDYQSKPCLNNMLSSCIKTYIFSNHKFMINNLKKKHISKTININLKNEYIKMLINADVINDDPIIDNIGSDNFVYFGDIKYNITQFKQYISEYSKNKNKKINVDLFSYEDFDFVSGDWTGLIKYITKFDIKTKKIEVASEWFENTCKSYQHTRLEFANLIVVLRLLQSFYDHDYHSYFVINLHKLYKNSPDYIGNDGLYDPSSCCQEYCLYYYSVYKTLIDNQTRLVLGTLILENNSVTNLWILIYLDLIKEITNPLIHNKLLKCKFIWSENFGFIYSDISNLNVIDPYNIKKDYVCKDRESTTLLPLICDYKINMILCETLLNDIPNLSLVVRLAIKPCIEIAENLNLNDTNASWYTTINNYDPNLLDNFKSLMSCFMTNKTLDNDPFNNLKVNEIRLKHLLFDNTILKS